MDERMELAVTRGGITALQQLIREDVRLLENIDELPFANTPLHIAASSGNVEFALDLMRLRPSFARKLDLNQLSPIHLALQNGHIELVRRLLQVDGDLLRVKGWEGLTPLHLVAKSDEHIYLLEEFLSVCPNSIIEVTNKNETALHVALQNGKLTTFKFLVRWLGVSVDKNAKLHPRRVLNWKDNEGNTVLHIAVSKNQTQAVRHLLARGYNFVHVNLQNLQGDTPWDILRKGQTQMQNEDIQNMLRCVKAKSSSSLSTFNRSEEYERLPVSSCFEYWKMDIKRGMRNLSEANRNMFLVISVLLVTMSFQAVLSPPGGLWQDNGLCNTTEVGSSSNGPTDQSSPLPNTEVGFIMPDGENKMVCEHKVGTATAFKDGIFPWFLTSITTVFVISSSLLIGLIPNGYMKILFVVLYIAICFIYSYALITIVGNPHRAYVVVILMIVFAFFFCGAQFYSWKQ